MIDFENTAKVAMTVTALLMATNIIIALILQNCIRKVTGDKEIAGPDVTIFNSARSAFTINKLSQIKFNEYYGFLINILILVFRISIIALILSFIGTMLLMVSMFYSYV